MRILSLAGGGRGGTKLIWRLRSCRYAMLACKSISQWWKINDAVLKLSDVRFGRSHWGSQRPSAVYAAACCWK